MTEYVVWVGGRMPEPEEPDEWKEMMLYALKKQQEGDKCQQINS